MTIRLRHSTNGRLIVVPTGYSWTTLCFGPLPALLRGDLKWFVIFSLLAWISFPFLVMPFIYNSIYLQDKLVAGYVICGEKKPDENHPRRKFI